MCLSESICHVEKWLQEGAKEPNSHMPWCQYPLSFHRKRGEKRQEEYTYRLGSGQIIESLYQRIRNSELNFSVFILILPLELGLK